MMQSLLVLQRLFVLLICILFITKAFNHPHQFEKYTFYYEIYQYPLNQLDDDQGNVDDTDNTNNTVSDSIYMDIMVDNLFISILKSSQQHPYEINIMNSISISFDNYDDWREVEIWNTPYRHRRRLRQCHKRGWRPFHHYTKRYWCKPIAPPRHDPYWIRRFKRVGRFIAVYPGTYAAARFNYNKCAQFCRYNYGGLASIHSHREKNQAKRACLDILVNPKAKNQRDYGGNWRGWSCYIGIRRPFKLWDDKSKYKFGFWQPGEPNNGGHRRVCSKRSWWGGCTKYEWRKNADEDCTELYAFHDGRWNDITCKAKRSCICQDPKGQIHGDFIGVAGMRTHSEANLYCKQKYGTTLATISSDEENQHVLNACKFAAQPRSLPHCWIGLKRPFHEWDDGTNADEKFENWYPGEPNNKNEKCVELYSEHRGLWNDLGCKAKRYFVCNARTKLQRMKFQKREEMIKKRLQRHKARWQKYQQQEKRRKIRKMFFEKMKAYKAMIRKQKREQKQRQREYMKQMAFKMGMQKRQKTMNGMFGSYGGGGFSANSVFGDNVLKRRRLRVFLKENNNEYKRKMNERMEIIKKKMKKREIFKKDKEFFRKIDGNEMFNDDDDDDYDDYDGFGELKDISEENVNPTPKRCVVLEDDDELYELCINDEYLFVKKYIEKIEKGEEYQYSEYVELDGLYGGNDTNIIDLEQFQSYKYMEAIIHDENKKRNENKIEIKKPDDNTQYMRIDEFIYDDDNNHKRQCYGERNPYRICLEYEDVEKDIILYVGIQQDSHFEFDENILMFHKDDEWNEVNYVNMVNMNNNNNNNNVDINQLNVAKIIKCTMFYESKICVIQQFERNNDKNDEYRAIIMTQMSDDDEEEYNPSNQYNVY